MINRLIDTYEDLELEVYHTQVDKLLKGMTLDYSFIRIDPFQGIKRKNNILMIDDMEAEAGFYSFLFNSHLFSMVNDGVRNRINFETVLLFLDEQYEIQITSGSYHSKNIVTKIQDLKHQSLFDEDKLILSLIKNKNLKVQFKLKEKGKTRERFERNCKLEDSEAYAATLLESFKKIKDYQIEDEKIVLFLNALGVPVNKDESREDLYFKIEKLSLANISIEKSILLMEIINKAIIKFRHLKVEENTGEKIISYVENRFKEKNKALKELDYKLKAPFITLRDRND